MTRILTHLAAFAAGAFAMLVGMIYDGVYGPVTIRRKQKPEPDPGGGWEW